MPEIKLPILSKTNAKSQQGDTLLEQTSQTSLPPLLQEPSVIMRPVEITIVTEVASSDLESSDMAVAKRASELCNLTGIPQSIIPKYLKEGHGYELTTLQLEQPFKVGLEQKLAEVGISEHAIVAYEIKKQQLPQLTTGVDSDQMSIVTKSQTLLVNNGDGKMVDMVVVLGQKPPRLIETGEDKDTSDLLKS